MNHPLMWLRQQVSFSKCQRAPLGSGYTSSHKVSAITHWVTEWHTRWLRAMIFFVKASEQVYYERPISYTMSQKKKKTLVHRWTKGRNPTRGKTRTHPPSLYSRVCNKKMYVAKRRNIDINIKFYQFVLVPEKFRWQNLCPCWNCATVCQINNSSHCCLIHRWRWSVSPEACHPGKWRHCRLLRAIRHGLQVCEVNTYSTYSFVEGLYGVLIKHYSSLTK